MRFISYYRVSTDKQGKSGLGLDAQRAAVMAYVRGGECVAEYTEVESGKRDDRPELLKAIEHASKVGAKLVIAKLDRLSRDPDFIGALMKANVDFVACDLPDANKLTIRIMAAVAEAEREAISKRTKDALAVKRERLAVEGKRLGNPRPAASLAKGKATLSAMAVDFNAPVRAVLEQHAGLSLAAKADLLNSMKITTRRGSQWTKTQVARVLCSN